MAGISEFSSGPPLPLVTFSNFSTFTTGFEIVVAVVVVGVILLPALTDFMGLIFILTPSRGAAIFFAAAAAGTCFKLAFDGRPDVTGLKVPLDGLLKDFVVGGGGGGVLEGRGMSNFLPNSELRAEAGIFPKLLRFVGPWRDSATLTK